jgi:hypothetical protein
MSKLQRILLALQRLDSRVVDLLRIAGLRLLRVPCGAYGGEFSFGGRWCEKPFGHRDSHQYEPTNYQPLNDLRRRAQGWDN